MKLFWAEPKPSLRVEDPISNRRSAGLQCGDAKRIDGISLALHSLITQQPSRASYATHAETVRSFDPVRDQRHVPG